MMKFLKILTTITVSCSAVSVAAQPAYDALLNTLYSHSVPTVQPDSLYRGLSNENPPVILDTRSKEEFDVSHLQNARWVDYDNFEPYMVSDLNKATPVVVYCSVGYRSEKIGEQLKETGFSDVRNLYGGIFQWKNKGYPIVNKKGEPTDSVHTYNRLWSVWLKEGVKVYD